MPERSASRRAQQDATRGERSRESDGLIAPDNNEKECARTIVHAGVTAADGKS
jgi:hypothetical protein